jgi:hypothetical protein
MSVYVIAQGKIENRGLLDHYPAHEWCRMRSHTAVTRVYDEAGNVIATHEQKGDFKEA